MKKLISTMALAALLVAGTVNAQEKAPAKEKAKTEKKEAKKEAKAAVKETKKEAKAAVKEVKKETKKM
ncbi:hypothetical protein OX283_011575 [Flavobacterium sp. SUN052]|uniref:hypothetical protein n=1 Tax=Flavobacterium sp. SUN052 TaxID=3002441 RepID=UPI00237EB106|nr:hypothetical protein [Flavobacterium sp. SUN052]MEC4005297.1 hypothetical protein [Flavobacterium sp. SUN052]